MVLKIEPDRPVRPVQQLVGHGFGPIRWIGPESGRTRIGSGEPTVRSANQTIQPFFFFIASKRFKTTFQQQVSATTIPTSKRSVLQTNPPLRRPNSNLWPPQLQQQAGRPPAADEPLPPTHRENHFLPQPLESAPPVGDMPFLLSTNW